MGLSIYVYKPVKKTNSLIKNLSYSILEKDSPLFMFKEFLFKKKIEYLNIEKTFEKGGLKIEDYNLCMQSGTEKSIKTDDFLSLIDGNTVSMHGKENCIVIIGVEEDILYEGEISNCYLEFHNETDGKRLIIINPLIDNKMESCICEEELGYQSKGANKQFYEDNIWDSDEIVDLKTLTSHWKKYFSDTKEMKNNFKQNIIDKFVEGETFVIYC